MPSARIRPPARKGRQEAHEGARPFAKPKKASEVFLVPGRIVDGAAQLAEQGFLRRQALRENSNGQAEFALSGRKVCLSPAIDRFDGMPIAWTMGTSPDSSLVSDMLCKVSRLVPKGVRCVIHSDRGCRYRWPGWIGLMDKLGFVRSMSKKVRSPGNSAREGFFGTIENEMFYNEGQSRMTAKEFIPYLENYLIWFRERRIKESLGYKSMIDRRREIGIS